MYSNLNKELEQNQAGMARLHKIDFILGELEREQRGLGRKEFELKLALANENADVEKLENQGLAALFYSVLGKLDDRIEKERQEALAAKLKYDQAVKDLKDVAEQIDKLSAERLLYVECPKEYERLFALKKADLMRDNGAAAQRIIELTNQAGATGSHLKEIKEAIVAGGAVLSSLDRVSSSLGSAQGWGTWDLLGGGLISDLAKHSHIDDAKAEVENVQRLLRRFKSELTDIDFNSDIFIETSGFVKFADFFFDGLVADWFMQSRIKESSASVENVKNQVLSVIAKLEQMQSRGMSLLAELESELQDFVVKE